ncbi:MAG: TetR/AcrR family transcriptional regulator [Anaerolineaceae bacterium]|nr:TetR/AcrR family transcriptional regulator [Anaerolineaceae bacterium]
MTLNEFSTEDLRVKRTHNLILEAFLDLTVQKGFSALTVSDIAKYAGINRATFYRHYTDKIDLVDHYARDVYELLDIPLETGPQKSYKMETNQIFQGLIRILDHIQANAKFYRVMLGKNGDPVFTDKIRQYIQKRIRRTLPTGLQIAEMSIDLYVSYSSSASIGAILWWLEHEIPYPPEEMATILHQLESGNLNAMVRGA